MYFNPEQRKTKVIWNPTPVGGKNNSDNSSLAKSMNML